MPYTNRVKVERFFKWFLETNSAYAFIQAAKPLTLGFGMHDSPIAMLAWMVDKLFLWSDSYPWTSTELITRTLLPYFPGPTTGFMMYFENNLPATMVEGSWTNEYLGVPSGFSAFPKELAIVPRSWAERIANVVFWKEHEVGGHFAMYEKPEELVGDLVKFYKSVWKG
ncbi:MAG: hypothetical protein M1830_008707 [Pleopsidium flavum]|nr:MAG: hypothetical protein M1830_008707 [Pleopsidium flavum]